MSRAGRPSLNFNLQLRQDALLRAPELLTRAACGAIDDGGAEAAMVAAITHVGPDLDQIEDEAMDEKLGR